MSCEECAPGYERSSQGPYLSTCVPVQQTRIQCSSVGSRSINPGYDGKCQCKMYAVGTVCDRCPPNAFHLSARNPQGCIPCFCSGVTQQCTAGSNYYRRQVIIDYRRGDTVPFEITTSDTQRPFTYVYHLKFFCFETKFSHFYFQKKI